jgi:tetratricopeptide (TPR) repeat protein
MATQRIEEKDPDSGFLTTELFYPDLANLPPLSLAGFENGWFCMLPLQYNYSFRPDVSIVTLSGLKHPDVIAYPEPVKYPLLFFPRYPDGTYLEAEVPGYPSIFFLTNVQNGVRVFLRYGEAMNDLIPYVEPSNRFLWLGELKMDHQAGINAVENGLYATYLDRVVKYMEDLMINSDGAVSPQAPPYIFQSISIVAEYLKDEGEVDLALETMQKFISIFVDKKGESILMSDDLLNSYLLIVSCNNIKRNYAESERIMNIVISLRPTFPMNYLLLGLIYNQQNRGELTLNALKKALELDPENTQFIYQYGQALAKYSSINDAVVYLNQKKAYLEEEGLYNLGQIVQGYIDCLQLPPNRDL